VTGLKFPGFPFEPF